ncbi:MAG TPA: FecR domain-containing protein [Dongiaceae bacterium]|nr:FecR domain-containing protein [Dongiaceae bacterium]
MTILSPNLALAEARQWYVRLQDDAITQAERRAFARWLTAEGENRQAWDEVMRQVQQLERDLAVAAPFLTGRYPLQATGVVAPVVPFMPQGVSRRQALRQAAAIGTVLVGGGLLVREMAGFNDFRSGPGERRQFQLADGSVVEIGSDTVLAVNFTAAERLITLREGDAFFVVAADAARPFVVQAGNVRVRALGTQFSLRARDEIIDVTVREHAVAVEIPGQPARRVTAGEGLRVADGRAGMAAPVDLAIAEAWRQDRMVFSDAALADVMAEIGRYRHGHIIITDRTLAGLRVSGSFHTDDTDAILHVIAATLPVRIEDFLGLVTLIRPAA